MGRQQGYLYSGRRFSANCLASWVRRRTCHPVFLPNFVHCLSSCKTHAMKFLAHIDVMPQKALLDPQGRAVTASMKNLDLSEIANVRIGKHITLEIDADTEAAALEKVERACKMLLANPIMETYSVELTEA
jgi:phosphoribosylformylglycinamidine synthase